MAADAGGEAVAEKEEPAGPSPAELFGESSELGQIFGPTNPAHAWEKPWTNLETQEGVQVVKAHSRQLKDPPMCATPGCPFLIHADPADNGGKHCCSKCRDGAGSHGPTCHGLLPRGQ